LAPVRLAIVADIHHGRDTKTKRGSAALPLLRSFIDDANRLGVQAAIDLGDRISDETAERDRELQAEVACEFARLNPPRYHLDGNHDRAFIDASAIEKLLGNSTSSNVVDLDEVRLLFWNADVRLPREHGFRLAPGDLEALRRLLGTDERRTLLFSHVPLSGHSQLGNYYFERCPDRSTYLDDLPAIRRVLDEAACPIVCLAGHVHWNTLTVVDGVPHITLQSLTETFTAGMAAACTGLLELDGDLLRWRVGGLDPITLELGWPRQRRRWLRNIARPDPADAGSGNPPTTLQRILPRAETLS
jgi:hypothetical protein